MKFSRATTIFALVGYLWGTSECFDASGGRINVRRLGKYYDWDRDSIICDGCNERIAVGTPRYKGRFQRDLDLCNVCINSSPLPRDHFIYLENLVEDMVFHEYFECG